MSIHLFDTRVGFADATFGSLDAPPDLRKEYHVSDRVLRKMRPKILTAWKWMLSQIEYGASYEGR